MVGLDKQKIGRGIVARPVSPSISKVEKVDGRPLNYDSESKTADMIWDAISGISYVGTVNVTYRDLVRKLGQPTFKRKDMKPYSKGGDKIRVEWVVLVGDKVFTIHDWKSDRPVMKENEWDISGPKGAWKECQALIAWLEP